MKCAFVVVCLHTHNREVAARSTTTADLKVHDAYDHSIHEVLGADALLGKGARHDASDQHQRHVLTHPQECFDTVHQTTHNFSLVNKTRISFEPHEEETHTSRWLHRHTAGSTRPAALLNRKPCCPHPTHSINGATTASRCAFVAQVPTPTTTAGPLCPPAAGRPLQHVQGGASNAGVT